MAWAFGLLAFGFAALLIALWERRQINKIIRKHNEGLRRSVGASTGKDD